MSQTLPYPIVYFLTQKNPILECLVDQMDHDEQRSGEKLTGLALRDDIITALTKNRIGWAQRASEIISKEEWIRLMKIDPVFYMQKSRNAQEMEDHETILLDLASKYLKKRITLAPFLEGDQERTFFPSRNDFNISNIKALNVPSYHLLCCNKAYSKNFFISIFPKYSKSKMATSQSEENKSNSFGLEQADQLIHEFLR